MTNQINKRLKDFSNRYDLFRGNKDMMMLFLKESMELVKEEAKIAKEEGYALGYLQGKKDGAETARIEDNL